MKERRSLEKNADREVAMGAKEDIKELKMGLKLIIVTLSLIIIIGSLIQYVNLKRYSKIELSPRTIVYNGEFKEEYCYFHKKVAIEYTSIQFIDPKYRSALVKNKIKDLRVVLKIGNKEVPGSFFFHFSLFVIEIPKVCLPNPVKEATIVIYSGKKKIGEGKVPVEVEN